MWTFVASYTGHLLLLPLAVLARLQQKTQRTVRRMVRRTRLPTLTLRRMISSCRGMEASVSSMLPGPAAAGYLPLHAAGDLPGPAVLQLPVSWPAVLQCANLQRHSSPPADNVGQQVHNTSHPVCLLSRNSNVWHHNLTYLLCFACLPLNCCPVILCRFHKLIMM